MLSYPPCISESGLPLWLAYFTSCHVLWVHSYNVFQVDFLKLRNIPPYRYHYLLMDTWIDCCQQCFCEHGCAGYLFEILLSLSLCIATQKQLVHMVIVFCGYCTFKLLPKEHRSQPYFCVSTGCFSVVAISALWVWFGVFNAYWPSASLYVLYWPFVYVRTGFSESLPSISIILLCQALQHGWSSSLNTLPTFTFSHHSVNYIY